MGLNDSIILQVSEQNGIMYTIIYKPNPLKVILLSVLVIICYIALYQLINYYLVHSTMIMISLTMLGLLFILRAIGIMVMYPGTFHYISAQVEKKQNDNLISSIHNTILQLQEICRKLVVLNARSIKTNFYSIYAAKIVNSLQNQRNLICKPPKSSQKKQQLINNYQYLIRELTKNISASPQSNIVHKQIQRQNNLTITCQQIFTNPRILLDMSSQQFQQFKQICGRSTQICQRIWQLCEQINAIQRQPLEPISANQLSSSNLNNRQQIEVMKMSKFKIAKWHFFSERLFHIQSYFAYWDEYFNYTLMMVPVGNGYNTECAIIHSQKSCKKLAISSKTVLFCNPNGALLQFFALNSSYINFYLKWGFKVVLWNYRGYANSTGFATISNCKADVYKVYNAVIKTGLNVVVLHGYSIGGVCAIDLAYKLNNQNLSERPIKLIIADRTFSSVDKVAQGFFLKSTKLTSKLLKNLSVPLVRLLFSTQCEDQSIKFSKIRCQKVVIYDIYDQVVHNQASLKYALQNLSLSFSKNNGKLQEQLKKIIKSFAHAVVFLFEKNTFVFQNIMRVLSKIDRPDAKIKFQSILKDSVMKMSKSIQKLLYNQAIKYLTSLIIFGPKIIISYSMKNMRRDKQQEEGRKLMRQQLKYCIGQIRQIFESMLLADQSNCKSIIKNITSALQFLHQQWSQQQSKFYRSVFGRLIVSQVGHNSELQSEYAILDLVVQPIIASES